MSEQAPDPDSLISKSLLEWSNRTAARYAARYGDPDDRFSGAVSEGLCAAVRGWERKGGGPGWPFDRHAKAAVLRALAEAHRRSGPLGYRRDQRKERNWAGAPSVSHCGAGVAYNLDLATIFDRVGWEVEYEDLVESLARWLPGRHGEVLRLLYLDCQGATVERAARVMGLSHSRVSEMHSTAIGMIRRWLGGGAA
jgi:hypothetical protein